MLIDTNGTKYLNDIQSICKQNKIQLMLIYAPEYKTMWQSKVSNAKIIFNTIDSFALKNQISFLRYDANEICENPNYFYNVRHLNTTGSSIFSVIVANDISK